MDLKNYIKLSLELHLFFDRIMKEHGLFLEYGFLEKESELKLVAHNFQNTFSEILEEVTFLANNNINSDLLISSELVTSSTLVAEEKTNELIGSQINTNITKKELNLKSGNITINDDLLNRISEINKKTLPVIYNLISFKNDILNNVLSCKMYTSNYPLLISHIMNEAKLYYNLLSKVENREPFSENYLYEQELFWNNIMKEHAEFIRGLLDTSEDELILSFDKFARKYDSIMNNYKNSLTYLGDISLTETISFKELKMTIEEEILNCKIRGLILPIFADHVVREANHFIRILKSIK